MNQSNVITPHFNAKQKRALRLLFDYTNGIIEILFGGAAGGGKSWLGCSWMLSNCLSYPGYRGLIGRARLKTLMATTYKTFRKVAKEWGLVQGVDWKLNGQTHTIHFPNGSEIILVDLFQYPSDPDFDELGSLEISGAFIDEANQVVRKAIEVVKSRIREGLDEFGITPKILLSCNPAPNHVYDLFYKPFIEGTLAEFRAFVQSLITDNDRLSNSYIAALQTMDEVTKARLLRGEWEYSDLLAMFFYSKIQETLTRRREVVRNDYGLVVDPARLGKDSTAIIVISACRVIVEIVHLRKKRRPEVEEVINELIEKYGIDVSNIVIDSDGVGGGLADSYPGCVEIVNNQKPFDGENYANVKTQLYFYLSKEINEEEEGLAFAPGVLNDELAVMIAEGLKVIRREKEELDGKISMTSKKDFRRMVRRSSDIEDVLAYSQYFRIMGKNAGYGAIY